MNTISSNVPNAPEHNEQYNAIGEQVYFALHRFKTPPGYKVEFKNEFGKANKIKDYFMPGVKQAFQDYILAHFGIKVSYEDEGSEGFSLWINDYDTDKGFIYPLLEIQFNNAVDFIVQELEKKGEVVFQQFEGRPNFFNKLVNKLLRSIGYTAKFTSGGRVIFERKADSSGGELSDLITTKITKLPQLKQLLDTRRNHKTAAEAVETEFSRDAINKPQNTDFGVVLVTNEMMSDDGFPSLVATIKQLASDPDKNIQVFAVDDVPAELGLRAIRPGNIIIGSPYKTRNEAGIENTKGILTGQEGTAHKKKLYGAGKTTTFIKYGDSEQEQAIVKFLKLLVFQKGLFPGHQVVE